MNKKVDFTGGSVCRMSQKNSHTVTRSRNRILVRYFRTYLLIFLIPLILCAAYLFRVASIVRDDDIQTEYEQLSHSAAAVDSLFEEMDRIGRMIVNNDQVNAFAEYENAFSYGTTYSVIDLQDSLPDLSFLTDSLYGYFIFFDKSQVVINKNIAYTYDDFYRMYLHDATFQTVEDWKKSISGRVGSYGLINLRDYWFYHQSDPVPMISYEMPLFTYSLSRGSRLILYVKTQTIDGIMPARQSDSYFVITGMDGKVIYSSDRGKDTVSQVGVDAKTFLSVFSEDSEAYYRISKVNSSSTLFLRYASKASGFTYYALIPMSGINSRFLTILIYLVVFLIVVTTIGILASFVTSKKNTEPIVDLFAEVPTALSSAQSSAAAFSELKTFYQKLGDTNISLMTELERQKLLLLNAFYSRLLYGSNSTEAELISMAQSAGFACEECQFWVVVFALEEEQPGSGENSDHEIQVMELIGAIRDRIPGSEPMNMGDQTVALIMSLPIRPAEDAVRESDYRRRTEQDVAGICHAFSKDQLQWLHVYGGSRVYTLSELAGSYEKASAMQRTVPNEGGQSICWYEADEKKASYPDLTLNKKQLSQAVMDGNVEGVSLNLEQIFQLTGSGQTMGYRHLAVDDMQILLLNLLDRIGFHGEKEQFMVGKLETNHHLPLVQRIQLTQDFFLELTEYMRKQRESRSRGEMVQVKLFLDMNYMDSGLSLSTVADEFHMGEAGLSTAFRQAFGVTFSAYVEQTRMREAAKLLTAGAASVKRIAEQTGYTSSNSFCRAFKRVNGVSPMEYRENGGAVPTDVQSTKQQNS